jgi:hypothetical protein
VRTFDAWQALPFADVHRPRFHKWPSLFQQVCSVIGRFNLVRDRMRERPLSEVSHVTVACDD